MTFCEDPPREGVIRLRCAYLELCTTISSRKRALTHGGHPLKYAASDSTMGQRRVGAVFAAIHAIEGHHRVLASHFIRRGNDKYKSCMSIRVCPKIKYLTYVALRYTHRLMATNMSQRKAAE